MNNQIRGGKRPEGSIDAMADGIIAATCSKMTERVLESCSRHLIPNHVYAGGTYPIHGLYPPYPTMWISENGIQKTPDGYLLTAYIQFFQ